MDISKTLDIISFFIIWYFLILNGAYITLLIASIEDLFRKFNEIEIGNIKHFVSSTVLPPVTFIVPSFNEEKGIIMTIRGLLRVNYPHFDIIVVDDGSTDKTVTLIKDMFDLYEIIPVIPQRIKTSEVYKYYKSRTHKNFTLIEKEHCGKADSLNVGINAARTPLFLSVDADSIADPELLSTLVFSMLSESHVVAQGGAVFVLNGCVINDEIMIEPRLSKKPLEALQACEYLRAFFFGRAGWRELGGPLILSGAISLFERQAIIEIGGFKTDAPGEDMEIVLRLNDYMMRKKFPYHILYSPVPVMWTEVPNTLNQLWWQRDRWQRGALDSLLSHIHMMNNPRFGVLGVFTYPFYFFGELFGPVVEFLGYVVFLVAIILDVVNWKIAALLFLSCWALSAILTLGVVLVNFISFNKYKHFSDLLYMFLMVTVEMFGYRQILTVCRTFATVNYFYHKIRSKIDNISGKKRKKKIKKWSV